ncbi:transposase [Pseudoalteromonas holothuriae]
MFYEQRQTLYPEFKEAAVKQITERGYSVAEVAERLDICTKKLYH